MAVDGLTTLVSTHYMDEAERCSRIVYLAQGRIVVQGGAAAVIGGSGLVTFEATGEGDRRRRPPAARRARASRRRGCSAARCISPAWIARRFRRRSRAAGDGLEWREVEPRLEDVFIHMLSLEEARR